MRTETEWIPAPKASERTATPAEPPFPTSSWWARIFFGIASIGGLVALFLIGCGLVLYVLGLFLTTALDMKAPAMTINDAPSVGVAIASIFVFWGMAKRLRKPWVYYLGAICLAWFTLRAFTSNALVLADLPPLYCRIIHGALMSLLLFRFTFGQPSRVYYRVARAGGNNLAPPPVPDARSRAPAMKPERSDIL